MSASTPKKPKRTSPKCNQIGRREPANRIDEMKSAKAIFGPPGTGKTRTLVDMAQGLKSVLFLSFTKAAALEVRSRAPQATASTIHSLVFNAMGMSRASVVDQDKLKLFAKASGIPFKGSEFGSDEIQEGDEYMNVLSYANNLMVRGDIAYDHFGQPGTWARFTRFVDEYTRWKAAYGYLDFDDMLKLYMHKGEPCAHDYVFLDEAQDCSPMQWLVFTKMCGEHANVVIAGDDDQAIYEWNGADPHGMVKFIEDNEGTMTILRKSYRVPPIVHDLAHEVCLNNISQRVEKQFDPKDSEGRIEFWGDISNIDMSQLVGPTMILTRDRWRQEEIKRELNREMMPYAVLGGHSPWTSRLANEIREGSNPEIPLMWREFYAQANLSAPVEVTLSTIHQAKGRESPRVILDLNLPARTLNAMYNDRDSELRVLYVALTRTSKELLLCGSNPLL